MTAFRRNTWLRDEAGQTVLETAISLLIVVNVIFGLFELSMLTYTCIVLNSASQQGVRYAIAHGTDSSMCSGPDSACTDQSPYANVQSVVTSAASATLHKMTGMTVTVSYLNGTAAPGNPVSVKVVYTYVPYLNLPGLAKTVTLTSQGMIVF